VKRLAEAVFNEIAEIEKRSKREESGPTLLARCSEAILPLTACWKSPPWRRCEPCFPRISILARTSLGFFQRAA